MSNWAIFEGPPGQQAKGPTRKRHTRREGGTSWTRHANRPPTMFRWPPDLYQPPRCSVAQRGCPRIRPWPAPRASNTPIFYQPQRSQGPFFGRRCGQIARLGPHDAPTPRHQQRPARMYHLLGRGHSEIPNLGLQTLLDRHPLPVYQEVVQFLGQGGRPSTGWRRSRRRRSQVALSWLQLRDDRGTRVLPLLVRQGAQSQIRPWPASSLVWPNLLQTTRQMPPSMFSPMPRRSMPSLPPDGPRAGLLLRKKHKPETMHRPGRRRRLQLRRDLRRFTSLR